MGKIETIDAPQPQPEQRTITLYMDAVVQSLIAKAVGSQKLYAALGYLSTWNQSFHHVDIYCDGKTDFIAVYRNADGTRGYTIGAIYSTATGDYSFHS